MRRLAFLLLASVFAPGSAFAVTMADLLAPGAPAPEVREFKRVGEGAPLRLFVFRPADADAASAGPRPAVVWIHGGGWVGGTTDGFMPHARYVATRGAVGVNIEYRLTRADGPTIADCIADCRSALRYLRAHAVELEVDPKRIAVAGDSAGGHLAAALGVLAGFDDPADDLALSGRPDAMLLFNPVLDLTEGNWPRSAGNDLARARELSPVFHVHPGQPPALLMHGLADTVVPASQAERFAAAARDAGDRCDLVLLPGTPHAFVVALWKSPEPVVVEALRAADRFLVSLGYFSGESSLEVSSTPAWIPRR